MSAPYDAAAEIYRMSGFAPIPVLGKLPPVRGCSGKAGTVTDEKIAEWLNPDRCLWCDEEKHQHRHRGYDNVALRHEYTLAIDIDEGYGAKRDGTPKQGVANLTKWAKDRGLSPLPPTWSSTARGDDSPSRQLLYQVDERAPLVDTGPCDDVEVPVFRHRYSVVFPSMHPDTGAPYRWYLPGDAGSVLPGWGAVTDRIPKRSDLARLPDDWLEALRLQEMELDPDATVVGLEELLDTFVPGEPSDLMRWHVDKWSTAHVGHEQMKKQGKNILILGRGGHPGTRQVWELFHGRYAEYVSNERPEELEKQLYGDDGIVAHVVRVAQEKTLSDKDIYRPRQLQELEPLASHNGSSPDPRRETPTMTDEPKKADAPNGERVVRLKRASEFVMRATDWAWTDRIPVGGLTLIAGREGEGKSTLMYTALSQLTRGTLPGDLEGTARNVAVAATEDSWELTIVPRLVAAGADLDRVFHIEVVNSLGAETVLQLPHDLAATERVLREADVPLLLLDPLMSRLEGRLDTHKDGEVRQALEPLVALADRARAAVVGLIHLNKAGGNDPLNAIMGSKAFVAVARSVLYVMRDPDDEQRRQRVVGLAKSNLTDDSAVPTLGFTIESRVVGEDPQTGKVISAGALVWGDEIGRSIRDMVADANEDPDIRSTRTEAKDWLHDSLKQRGGSSMRKEIMRAGKSAGFSESTLKRAAKELRLKVSTFGYPRESCWALPDTLASVGSAERDSSRVSSETPRSDSVGSAYGESDLTELTELTEDQLKLLPSVGSVGSVSPTLRARDLTGGGEAAETVTPAEPVRHLQAVPPATDDEIEAARLAAMEGCRRSSIGRCTALAPCSLHAPLPWRRTYRPA